MNSAGEREGSREQLGLFCTSVADQFVSRSSRSEATALRLHSPSPSPRSHPLGSPTYLRRSYPPPFSLSPSNPTTMNRAIGLVEKHTPTLTWDLDVDMTDTTTDLSLPMETRFGDITLQVTVPKPGSLYPTVWWGRVTPGSIARGI